MAFGNSYVTQTDNFIKSSLADFNDPVFLTFTVNFFPIRTSFQNDGITNDNLLMAPASLFSGESNVSSDRYSRNLDGVKSNNSYVEYSAYDWLGDYYPAGYTTTNSILGGYNPQKALGSFILGLADLQSSPWYFQSIQGISDLWKTTHRVKEGNKKATITFNCLESIRQPLTDIAENYRYAVYDEARLAYRLPDNLRWFDMEICLIEIRNIVDHSNGLFRDRQNDLYKYDSQNNLTAGLKTIKFRLRMCEFDFSDFIAGSGGQTEHKSFIEEKPFSPSFKVNVGWVEQAPVPLSEAEDVRKLGLFSGAFNALNNRLSNVLSAVSRLPGSIVGSVMNDIQTRVEGVAMGNVYDGGLNGISNAINQFGAAVTGRQAPVGPPTTSLLNTDTLPPPEIAPNVSNIGDVYP